MSVDEKSRSTAQTHLEPGETLIWAGQGLAKAARLTALWPAVFTLLFFFLVGIFAACMLASVFHHSYGVAPIHNALDFLFSPWGFFCAFTSFGILSAAIIAAVELRSVKRTTYAITNRRILFLSMGSGQSIPTAVYGPEDIEFIRRRDSQDGRGDLFFRRTAAKERDIFQANEPVLPFLTRAPEVGLLGIPDAETVEPLLFALRAGKIADVAPVPPPASPTAAPFGERQMTFDPSAGDGRRIVGAVIALFGSVIVGLTIADGLGLNIFTSAGGTTPPSPASHWIGVVIGLVFTIPGLYVFFWREWLTVDRVAETYRLQRGLAGFTKPISGTFAEFERLQIVRKDHPAQGESASYVAWHVYLVWKDTRRKPYQLLMALSAPHAQEQGRRIAAALGLPLHESFST